MGWRYIFPWKILIELFVVSLDAVHIVSSCSEGGEGEGRAMLSEGFVVFTEKVSPVEHQGMMCVRKQTMPLLFSADAIADG